MKVNGKNIWKIATVISVIGNLFFLFALGAVPTAYEKRVDYYKDSMVDYCEISHSLYNVLNRIHPTLQQELSQSAKDTIEIPCSDLILEGDQDD